MLEDADKGYYSLSPRHTEERGLKMRLDISGASRADGANVQLYTSNGSNAQRFILEKIEGANTRSMANGKEEVTEEEISQIEIEEEVLPLDIYPNPSTNGSFTIQGIQEGSQIQMYDLQGRNIIINLQSLGSQWVKVQGGAPLTEGLYIVRILQADGTIEQRKIMVRAPA